MPSILINNFQTPLEISKSNLLYLLTSQKDQRQIHISIQPIYHLALNVGDKEIVGLGILESLLSNAKITDILVNGHNECRNFVNSKGAVTAEAAVNSLSIVMLLGACMSVLIIMHSQFSVYEAARTSSRMLARGESDQVV